MAVIDRLRTALAFHEDEAEQFTGYALVIFRDDGTFTMDAEAAEGQEAALDAILDMAETLGVPEPERHLGDPRLSS